MLCKTRGSYGVYVVALLFCLTLLSAALQAQTPVLTVATDSGPRPTGREALNSDPNAVCPIPGAKFPLTVCLDFVQPPNTSTVAPADGAGQVITGGGNLTGNWFEALTVFSTEASVDGTNDDGIAKQEILGLGPSFNAQSCFECHSQPAVGGSSPGCVNNNAFCSNMAADPNTGSVLERSLQPTTRKC
jgi:hypothetical protein